MILKSTFNIFVYNSFQIIAVMKTIEQNDGLRFFADAAADF